jgi:rhodanese-related sulfurtransferase
MKKSSALFSLFGITQLVMIAAVGTALWLAYEPWRWGKLKDEVHAKYPEVPRISTEDLANWLGRTNEVRPLLLDVRSEPEYNASHLPGALWASAPAAEVVIENKLDRPLVLYCTVGFDSSLEAARLVQRGHSRVQMLEGGIFLWANEERALENAQGKTGLVSPGKSPYVGFLEHAHRAP